MNGVARYTVVVDRGDGEFFAYVPVLPGCTSVGQTRGQALDNVTEAIELTLEYLAQQGMSVPESVETIAEVEVN